MDEQCERLSEEEVQWLIDLGPTSPVRRSDVAALAREVLASRKLIAEMRALPYTFITTDFIRQMIDGAGL